VSTLACLDHHAALDRIDGIAEGANYGSQRLGDDVALEKRGFMQIHEVLQIIIATKE